MFESCYIDSRNKSKPSWFVGFVIFYFEHNNKSCDTTNQEYTSFSALIEVMKSHKVADYDPCIPIVTINKPKEKQLVDDPECRIIDPKYAVINLSDITRQVGLVQSSTNNIEHSVISSYYVFDKDIKSSVGSIQNL
ncbi:hypothetical protein BD770DRAFT_477977 [Pilaira anomala]|nr:hypothetical protein BD770DRAFT_477977 [Pilaira anomala]